MWLLTHAFAKICSSKAKPQESEITWGFNFTMSLHFFHTYFPNIPPFVHLNLSVCAQSHPWSCWWLCLTCISCTWWWILAGSALWSQQTHASGERDPYPTEARPGALRSRWSQLQQGLLPRPLLTRSSGAGLVLTTSIETWGPPV